MAAADNFIATLQQQQIALSSPQFLSPTPPSPQAHIDKKSFLRRIRPGPEPAASPEDTPPTLQLHSSDRTQLGNAPEVPEAVANWVKSAAVAPPPPPRSKQTIYPFIRREALHKGTTLQQSLARRISYESPDIVPLHTHDSPVSSASQVSDLLSRCAFQVDWLAIVFSKFKLTADAVQVRVVAYCSQAGTFVSWSCGGDFYRRLDIIAAGSQDCG